MRKLLYLLIILFLSCSSSWAAQQERITNFTSKIIVNKDASIDITEFIEVYANQDRILHGIVRRLPITYTDSYGIFRHTDYDILNVWLDQKKSAFHTQTNDNQLSVYIGDKRTFLSPGNYTYSLHYQVDNAVNFLSDGDELYWNITGNDWDFPIEETHAIILLPTEAHIVSYTGYTGRKGEKNKNYVVSQLDPNEITFSTGLLSPGSGLTIAVSWQKGVIQQPTWSTWLRKSLHRGGLVMMELTFLVFIYYFLVWYAHGRDPKKGTIIPLFSPPDNLTPEAMRYIARMGYDNKTFSAAIINLAANGFLTIDNDHNTFTLSKIKKPNTTLSREEELLLNALFSSGSTLLISQDNHTRLQKARSILKDSLRLQYQGKYFVRNLSYLIPGWGLTAIAFGFAIFLAADVTNAFMSMVWLGFWTFACAMLLMQAFNAFQLAKATRSFTKMLAAVFASLFTLPFLVGEVIGIVYLGVVIPIFIVPMLFLLVVLNFIFYHLLKVPTQAGRAMMDKIEGFKLFFVTTERYRVQQFASIEKTPALFEKYLPYAIALDVESEWTEQFNEILRQAGIEPSTYHPSWYSGPAWSTNTGTLPLFIGAGLASSLASASTSSSSSASGGGGSSGGGGGGGGGGGW